VSGFEPGRGERARGEEVRIDDTSEVLIKRLASYRSQTEPLIHYYSERRKLLTVDGMMTIEHVTRGDQPHPCRDRRGGGKASRKRGRPSGPPARVPKGVQIHSQRRQSRG